MLFLLITPDPGGSDAVADAPGRAFEQFRTLLVNGPEAAGGDVVEVPQRPVVRPDVQDVLEDVLRVVEAIF